MRALLAVLVLLTLAFAGCASKGGDDDPGATGTSTQTATTASSATSTTAEPAPNQAPTATLSAVVNGTLVAFELNGTDLDGDALSWNLTFGDGNSTNGTQFPSQVNHTYAPGSFMANLTVSDGKASTVHNVTFNVTTAAVATTEQVASGDWVAGNLVTGCFGDIFTPVYPGPGDGVFYASFDVDPATVGQTFVAVITSDGVADSPGFTFLDAAGEVLSSAFELEGEVPEGAATGIWWVCAGGPMSGTYQTPA